MKSISKITSSSTKTVSFLCHHGVTDENATFQLYGKDINNNNTDVVYKADGTVYQEQKSKQPGLASNQRYDTNKLREAETSQSDTTITNLDLDYNLF